MVDLFNGTTPSSLKQLTVTISIVLRRNYDNQACPVARALEVVGERWTFLIVRDALFGVTRFDGFLTSLGIPRNVLTSRLADLVENGVLERVPYQQRPVRFDYLLTETGRALAPVILSLMEWGGRFGSDEPKGRPTHHDCGGHVHARLRCAECGRILVPDEVTAIPVAISP